MKVEPLFSVLIANYNNGRFLQEAIDSVLEQTYSNWEVIIVDDKSTDNSFEIYEKYKDDGRFHVYYNEKNMGCGYTKRRCAELANGEICGFLDPDDTLMHVALRTMVDNHKGNPNSSLVFSLQNRIDANTKAVTKPIPRDLKNSLPLLFHPYWSHFASFKRFLYNKTEGINPDFKRAVDDDLYLKLEEVGDVSFVQEALYNYRVNTGQNISQNENGSRSYVWHLAAITDAIRRRNLDDDLESIIAADIDRLFEELLKDMKETCADEVRNTKAYRLGRFLLKPFSCIRDLIKRNKRKM